MCTVSKGKALGLISEDYPDEGNDGNQHGDTGNEEESDPIARAVSMQMSGISGLGNVTIGNEDAQGNDDNGTSTPSAQDSPTTTPAIDPNDLSNNDSEPADSDAAIPNPPSTPYSKPLTHLQAASLTDALQTPLPPAGSTPPTTSANVDSPATQPPSNDSNPFPRLTKEALQHPQFAKTPPGKFEHPALRALRAEQAKRALRAQQSSSPQPPSSQVPATATNPARDDALRAAAVTPAPPSNSLTQDEGFVSPNPRKDEISDDDENTGSTTDDMKVTKRTAAANSTGVLGLAGSAAAEEGKGKGRKDG